MVTGMSLLTLTAVSIIAIAAGGLSTFWLLTSRKHASRGSRYAAMLEQSPTGTLIADAISLRVIDANLAFQRSLGYSLSELRGLLLTQLFADNRSDAEPLAERLANHDPGQPLRLRLRQLCKNGSSPEVEAVGHRWLLAGRPMFALTTADVTLKSKIEAQLLEKQLRLDHLAHHDQLTGLPNRLYLAHHLPIAIEEARSSGTMLAVLFLDLDRFKHINDSRGHEIGDRLLRTVAERVRDTVRKDDEVVRMGGDEFIVVLKQIKRIESVSELAARINDALSAPVLVDTRPLVTTVSIGVSLFPRDGADMGELLRHSDTAMYQAKDRGRNNFQLFSPGMARKLRERVAIEASLRAALQGGHLDVHYQPIVEISSQKVMWLEALLRWEHPHQGSILPGRFIDIAEETGLIVPIGEFVLEHVVQDLSNWRRAGFSPVPVSVNISAVQLQRSNLHERIVELTRKYDVSPGLLQLELTESAMFERREGRDGSTRRDALSRLRELGVGMAIDDFGTGYSSLSYLKQWHVDYLKIDRSFVRDLVTDLSDLAIVGAIIAMARHLNVKVVAEGIEGWQQLEKLRELGCSFAQGFLFARPAPSTQCGRFLTGQALSLTAGARESEPTAEFNVSGIFSATGR
jgi:diguanylate cyclase (GGDEF)-like protein/PAS domain S-box-containing protein